VLVPNLFIYMYNQPFISIIGSITVGYTNTAINCKDLKSIKVSVS